MKMDARRQRRLGPAPIASFEKSFEDNNAGAAAAAAALQQAGSGEAATEPGATTDASVALQGNNGSGSCPSASQQKVNNPLAKKHPDTSTRQQQQQQQQQHQQQQQAQQPPHHQVRRQQQQQQQQQQFQQSAKVASDDATCAHGVTGTSSVTAAMSDKCKSGGGIGDGGGGGAARRAPSLKATANLTAGGGGGGKGNNNKNSTLLSATSLTTPSTPRIELSRASSSSHHEDSRESSPENVFEQVGTGTLQETIGLGFREEGALEMRSSTEELYFMDPEQKREERDKLQLQQQQASQQPGQQQQQQQQQAKRSSPHIFKFDDQQTYLQQHQRKDSASSEVAALLCISGRTSRISSVGSQGSAVSRLSAVSGISRSPSPHRMLLETSFCGPKPMENVSDGGAASSAEPAERLEQVLLARRQDPTQAVLAEGIKVETTPKKKRKPTSTMGLSNGDAAKSLTAAAANVKPKSNNLTVSGGTANGAIGGAPEKTTKTLAMGQQRRSTKSPGQMVVGKTPGGTEYIRINLKPDHLYGDRGIAANERVVEAPNTLAPVYPRGQKKPGSLSLGAGGMVMDETRLTPTASPKPSRQNALAKAGDAAVGSRSPSPAAQSVSRKSSFSSLFRFGGGTGKDSPDSPRDRSRSRSKSKERGQTPQSQSVTPSKQKSVLGLFKPGKRGSGGETRTSKCSSPVEGGGGGGGGLHSNAGSRPASRLRYYDEPVEGVIHIPLHTPPDEKETRQLLQGIQQLNAEPVRPSAVAITANQLAAAAAALKPIAAVAPKEPLGGVAVSVVRPSVGGPPVGGVALPCSRQIEKLQRRENLDAIHTLTRDGDGDADDTKERTWSLEVSCHTSSQESQETVASEGSCVSAIKLIGRSQLANLSEHVSQENGEIVGGGGGSEVAATAEIHSVPKGATATPPTSAAKEHVLGQVPKTVTRETAQATSEEEFASRERKRLLFATRLGSGSQEQVFSTQFSISKTESLSSQLSEQIGESSGSELLQRQDTVIRRPDEEVKVGVAATPKKAEPTTKRVSGGVGEAKPVRRQKSQSTSEDERGAVIQTTVAAVVMRRKESSDEMRRKSRSTSEEDGDTAGSGSSNRMSATQRHSRYLENFDVRRNYRENVSSGAIAGRQKTTKTTPGSSREGTPRFKPRTPTRADSASERAFEPQLPQLPPPPPPPAPPQPPSSPPAISSTLPATKAPRSRSGTPTKPPRSSTTPTRSGGQSTMTTTTTSTTPPSPLANLATVLPNDRAADRGPSSRPTKRSMAAAAAAAAKERQSVHSTDEPFETSDSDERESDQTSGATRCPSTSNAGGGGGSSTAPTIDGQRRAPLQGRHICGLIEDHESTGLVSQESFDDELPYVPTTLPEERGQGIAMIPMKERANMELKTFPVDRPRSTTPLNPSHLEEYCGIATPDAGAGGGVGGSATLEVIGFAPVRGEKLRISLPRKDSASKDKICQSAKSPRRISNAGSRSWFEFAEEGLRAGSSSGSGHFERKDSSKQLLPSEEFHPTKVTAKGGKDTKASTTTVQATQITPTSGSRTGGSTQRKLSGHWIDFENIPEKRKPPKRITTLPRDGHSAAVAAAAAADTHHGRHKHGPSGGSGGAVAYGSLHGAQPDVTVVAAAGSADGKLHYNYVEPEDCQCECHEQKRTDHHGPGGEECRAGAGGTASGDTASGSLTSTSTAGSIKAVKSVDLLQQGEDMLPLLDQDVQDGMEPSDSSREFSCYTDDEADTPVRSSGSRRLRSNASKTDEFPRRGTSHSPRSRKFPDQ